MNYQENLELECPDIMNCYVVSYFLSNISPGLRQWNIRHDQFSAVNVEGSASYTEAVRLLSLFSLVTELYSIERILSTNLAYCAHSLSLLSFVPPLSLSLTFHLFLRPY